MTSDLVTFTPASKGYMSVCRECANSTTQQSSFVRSAKLKASAKHRASVHVPDVLVPEPAAILLFPVHDVLGQCRSILP